MNFVCPCCGSDRIEEILVNAVVSTEVTNVGDDDGEADMEYGDTNVGDGEVQNYQCLKCGGGIANDRYKLLEWLKERNML